MRYRLAPFYVLRFCVMYSIKGHESEMAVVDYRVGWRRIFRCQLGNRPLDLPTFRDPNTVLLYVSSFLWPVDSSCLLPTWSYCFSAPAMENEDYGRVDSRIGACSRVKKSLIVR